jgi:outer membrane lipoprotein SlyB
MIHAGEYNFMERLSSARIGTERLNLEARMKARIGFAAIIFALATVTSAEAKGCLKGAAVGGVAGHFAGHHGVMGAAAGCVIGRHEANKRDRMHTNQTDQPNRELRNGDERL